MQIRSFLLFIIISGIFWKAAAQDKTEKLRLLKTVTVTLPGGFTSTTGGGIPFDESFNLSGSAAGIERIELFYRVSPFQGKRTFWFKVCDQCDTTVYNITRNPSSDQIIDYVIENRSAYIKINTKNLKPTQKKQLDIGFKLNIPSGKINPITKKAVSVAEDRDLVFDGYQLVLKDEDKTWETDKISPEYYFPSLSNIGSDGYIRNPIAWEKNGDTFNLNVGPLHANVLYDFQFKVYTRPSLSDAERTKLMDELIAIVKKEYQFERINDRTTDDDKVLNDRLAATVAKSFNKGGKLVAADLNHYELTHLSPPVVLLKKELITEGGNALQIEERIKSAANDFFEDQPALLNTGFYTVHIKKYIDDINGSKFSLLVDATNVWTGNLPETTIPVKTIAGIFADKAKVMAILNGTSKIDANGGVSIVAPALIDQQSILYFYEFFKALSLVKFNVQTTGAVVKQVTLFQNTGFQMFHSFFEQIKMGMDVQNVQLVKEIILRATNSTKGRLNDPQSNIKAALQPIVTNTSKTVSDPTKALMDMPLHPGIAEYKTIKVADAAMLVYNSFANPYYFQAILSGKGMIDPTGKFVDANSKDEVHIPSVKVLISIFRLLNSPAFTNTSNQLIFSSYKTDLDFIIFKLERFSEELNKLQSKKADMDVFRTEMGLQIASLYMKKSYFITGSSIIDMDVKADKNPYIGVDVGMGYAFGPKAVFINEGINIYFRPINRDVAISAFHGWDRFFKTFSIYLGVSQNLSDNADESGYVSLFNSGGFKSNLVFGAGYRVNSLMRLNLGGLIYRQSDANPLISNTKVKVSPTFSVAIDLALSKLLKPFTSMF